MDKEVIQYIKNWIQKAEHDFKAVTIILDSKDEDKPYDTVCFHCQQSVEKYLKAYLVYLDVLFPKTHNISHLIEIGSEVDQKLRQLSKAEILTAYSVDTRYPDDFYMPTKDEADEAYSIALVVKIYITSRLSPILNKCE